MKYLKTYETYKSSQQYGDVINSKEFDTLLQKHCKNYSDDNVKLYRGVSKLKLNDYYYLNPKGHKRKSIEPQNIHVVLMSELDSWKEFPKYDESVIVSTNKKYADSYGWDGTLFEVIPYDNTKFGVCSDSNIWDVFGGFDDSQNTILKVSNFLNLYLGSYDDDWGHIQDEILKIKEPSDRISNIKKDPYDDDFVGIFLESLYEYKGYDSTRQIKPQDIIDTIEDLFEPKRNGFEKVEYIHNYNETMQWFFDVYNTENLQLWCEGPVLLRKIEMEE